jgi:class 3 adenylate cyclase
MSDRPGRARRIVALCLTDVEQSSQLWLDHPSLMPDAIAELDATIEDAARSRSGQVVKTRGEGDSHFVVFDTASDAVAFAAAVQRRLGARAGEPDELRLKVRIAVHAGEVDVWGDDYLGIAINQAARLRSVAHGDQIVTSRVVGDLVAGRLDDDLRLEHLGSHRIRDLPGWTDVYQARGPGLAHDFPPLQTVDQGLPPIATILFLDVVGAVEGGRQLTAARKDKLMSGLARLLAATFARSSGRYLKQFGDGCLALFDDPDEAIAFAHIVREGVTSSGFDLRGALHVGRVRFGSGEPVGQGLRDATVLLESAAAGRIALSPAAATLLDTTSSSLEM